MIHKSDQAKLYQPAVHSPAAGIAVTNIVEFELASDLTAAADVIEMALLPAFHQLLALELVAEGNVLFNATVSVLEGRFADAGDRPARDPDIVSGAAQNATLTAATAACLAIARPAENSSLAVTVDADLTAANNVKLTMIATMIA